MSNEMQQFLKFKSVVCTKSPIRAWFLSRVCGQKVWTVRATPLVTLMGIIFYTKSWILVA